jgi:hypothetical protein
MKMPFLITLAAIGVGVLTPSALAQTTVVVHEPVVRGRVVLANPQSRIMTVSVASRRAPVKFYRWERARIMRTGGRPATFAELRPGTEVVVHYAPYEGRWYPQSILLPDPNLVVPPTYLSPAEGKALHSPAANDGDITTNPGVKARIDTDITTKPGQKDPLEQDITKRRD